LRTIGLFIWQHVLAFVKRAGSIILVASIAIWALSSLPSGDIEASYLAKVGRGLAPLGGLMGLDWRMMVALLSSFIAKENSIATLGVLFGLGEEEAKLGELLRGALQPAGALAFLVVQMLFVPCAATVGTIKQETGSWRWTIFSVSLLLVGSFAAGIAAYQLASLMG